MGGLRVTQQIMVQRVLNNLNAQTRRILQLQDQLATGRRVIRPSDDPIDARRAINTRNAIARNEQYQANISIVAPQLAETDTAIQSVQNYLQRARELTLRAANGTFNQAQLDAIAEEINQLLEGIFTTANHTTGDRYIFAGTRTLAPAYDATRNAGGEITAVTFPDSGTRNLADERIEVAISDSAKVVINEVGPEVFQSAVDIFQLLINIRDDIRAGNQSDLQNLRLNELHAAGDQLMQALARVGARQNRLERATLELQDFNIQYRQLLSDTIDADFAEVVINLNAQSNAYQAALSAAARVIQPSLLDFVS